jgi:O-antigen/teichoic acid export membrane protein
VPVTVVLLEAGFGVRGLLYAALAASLFFGVASVLMAFTLLPGLRVWPTHWHGGTFATLFSFGWRAQVGKLSNLINFQTDRVVVASVMRFGDMGLVGLYGLGEMLASKKRQIPALLVSALIPAASDLDARNSQDKLRALCIVSTKYMAAVAVPLAVFFAASADLLLLAWLGPKEDLHIAAWVLRILSVGYLFNVLPGPGLSVVLGKGRADLPMFAGLISMAANIAATIMLYWTLGFYGIPLATSLAMALSSLWFFRQLRHLFNVTLTELLSKSLIWPLLASTPGLVLCLASEWWAAYAQDQFVALGAVALVTPLFGLTYALCLRWAPFIDAFDVAFLGDTLRLRKLPGFKWFTERAAHA